MPSTAPSTIDCLFAYRIDTSTTSLIEHIRPVPSFLCDPSVSLSGSPDYLSAVIDVVTLVNAEFHDECMRKITTTSPKSTCSSCDKPPTDALKSPMSYLHLPQPMIAIFVAPVCGSSKCEKAAREQLAELQKQVMQGRIEKENQIPDHMKDLHCARCGNKEAKKCKRCGLVAYCSKECQKKVWQKHKKVCVDRHIGEEVGDPEDMPM